MNKSSKDIIVGAKFGRWTILEINTQNPNSNRQTKVKWAKCQCECGTIRYKEYRDLYSGRSQSCGCLRREQVIQRNYDKGNIEIGSRFGKLTVIEDLGYRKQNSRNKNERWSLCKCDCGNITEVSNNNLKSGRTQSCGCVQSRGETIIRQILDNNNINFVQQYTFNDLVGKKNNKLRFDFAIFQNNQLYCLLEFQGRQHFFGPDTTTWSHADSLEDIQYRDNLKKEYCLKHNYPLYYINYNEMNQLSWEFIKNRLSL